MMGNGESWIVHLLLGRCVSDSNDRRRTNGAQNAIDRHRKLFSSNVSCTSSPPRGIDALGGIPLSPASILFAARSFRREILRNVSSRIGVPPLLSWCPRLPAGSAHCTSTCDGSPSLLVPPKCRRPTTITVDRSMRLRSDLRTGSKRETSRC